VTGTSPDGGLTDTITFTIQVVNETVTVSPSPVTVALGNTQQFTAAVVGNTNMAVTWSFDEAPAGGSISATGAVHAVHHRYLPRASNKRRQHFRFRRSTRHRQRRLATKPGRPYTRGCAAPFLGGRLMWTRG
jgi:Bacterial Ig-like domain (group 2)